MQIYIIIIIHTSREYQLLFWENDLVHVYESINI